MSTVSKKTERPLSTVVTNLTVFFASFFLSWGGLSVVVVLVVVVVVVVVVLVVVVPAVV